MQTYGTNSSCQNSSDPVYCEMIMKAYERNDRRWAAQQRKLTANSGQLILNASIAHRYRPKSQPLIPPTINYNEDSSLSGDAVTLNVAPNMLLPPNTMEVVINARRRELAANQQPSSQPPVSIGSGPLIPPKMIW